MRQIEAVESSEAVNAGQVFDSLKILIAGAADPLHPAVPGQGLRRREVGPGGSERRAVAVGSGAEPFTVVQYGGAQGNLLVTRLRHARARELLNRINENICRHLAVGMASSCKTKTTRIADQKGESPRDGFSMLFRILFAAPSWARQEQVDCQCQATVWILVKKVLRTAIDHHGSCCWLRIAPGSRV